MNSKLIMNVDNEYAKNPNLKKDDINALMEWADKQAHLPRITEFEAILFLHSCYYRNEVAKKAIDDFFTIRTHSPEIFTNRDTAKMKNHINTVLYSVLPKKTDKGYKLLYSRIMDSNTDRYVMNEQVKLYDMCAILDLITCGTHDGIVMLLDMKNSTIGHLAKFNLLTMKKFLTYVQESIPLRLKEIHLMNAMPFTDKLLALIKPFMKKEFLNILHVHMDMESLYKVVPKECLPNDYGGSIGTLNDIHDETRRKFLEYRDYFIEDEKRVVDENKRLGRPKNADQIFGVEGTFKKLAID